MNKHRFPFSFSLSHGGNRPGVNVHITGSVGIEREECVVDTQFGNCRDVTSTAGDVNENCGIGDW